MKYVLPILISFVVTASPVHAEKDPASQPRKNCKQPPPGASIQRNKKAVLPCIRRASITKKVSYPLLIRKARCETGGTFSPYSKNPFSAATGLFQFMPSTWTTTPYAHHSIWSAKWNSLGAAWMHKVGRGGEWECQ